MICKNCGAAVRDGARFCTSCGAKMEPVSAAEQAGFGTGGQAGNSNSGMQAGGVNETVNTGTPVKGPADRTKLLKILIPVIAAVAVLLILLFATPFGRNFVLRTFASPQNYYQYVESKNISETVSVAAEVYDNLFREPLSRGTDTQSSFTLKANIGDKGSEMLNDYLGNNLAYEFDELGLSSDFSWLRSIGISGTLNSNNGRQSGSASIALNDKNLFETNLQTDGSENLLLQIPSIKKSYLQIPLQTVMGNDYYYYDMQEIEDAMDPAAIRDFYEALPKKSTVEKLLVKYLLEAANAMDDVTKDKEELTAGNVSAKYMTLTVDVNTHTLGELFKVLSEKVENDKDLQKVIEDVAGSDLIMAAGDGTPAKSIASTAVSEMTYELQSASENLLHAEPQDLFTMKVYVDGSGKIVGRRFSANGATLRYAMPQNGKNMGIDIQLGGVEMSGTHQSVSLIGAGRMSGGKFTGDITVTAAGLDLVNVGFDKFDIEELKKGWLNGGIILSAGDDISKAVNEMLDEYYYYSYYDEPSDSERAMIRNIAEQLSLRFDFKNGRDKYDIQASVNMDDGTLGGLTMSGTVSDSKKVGEVKAEDPETWISDVTEEDIRSFTDSLKKTDIPADYLNMMDRFLDENLGYMLDELKGY